MLPDTFLFAPGATDHAGRAARAPVPRAPGGARRSRAAPGSSHRVQTVLDRLAALVVEPAPVLADQLAHQQAQHILGQTHAQQVALIALLQFGQNGLIAVTAVATHQRRAARAQFVQKLPQPRFGVRRRVLFAGADLHIEHQPQIAHPVGV